MSAPQQPDGENLLREAVSTTPHCLTIEQLDEYAHAAAAKEQMQAFSSHLASCARCANELAMLREFLGAEVPEGQREDVRAVARALGARSVGGPPSVVAAAEGGGAASTRLVKSVKSKVARRTHVSRTPRPPSST